MASRTKDQRVFFQKRRLSGSMGAVACQTSLPRKGRPVYPGLVEDFVYGRGMASAAQLEAGFLEGERRL